PGAYYKRMYGEHARPHLYELIDQTADHYHWDTRQSWTAIRQTGVTDEISKAGGGHAHSGLMLYLGENWPAQYRNTLFTINFHGKRLNNDIIERDGATYTAYHGPDLVTIGDPWFRGVDLFYGPDGGVFISDWSDTGECHNTEAINRTSGRIYKLTYGTPLQPSTGDLAKLPLPSLALMQTNHNEWLVRHARQLLQERAAAGEDMSAVRNTLTRMFNAAKADANLAAQLRLIWALYVAGGTDEAWLRPLLSASNEQVRVWAIQLLCDHSAPSAEARTKLARLAGEDSSGLVLTFLASALRRFPLPERWPILQSLARRGEFAQDRVLPLMIWYGLEPAVPGNSREAVSLAKRTTIPKLRRFVARRIFEDLDTNGPAADQLVQFIGANHEPDFQSQILTGISEALRTVRHPVPPPSWSKVRLAVANRPDLRELAEQLDAMFGDATALAKLKAVLSDTHADLGARRKALQTLLQTRPADLSNLLTPLLTEVDVAPDAIRALASIGEPQTAARLLESYSKLPGEAAKSEAINALAGRLLSANALLDAIQHGVIPRQAVNPSQMQQLRSLKNEELDAKLNSIWPELDESPSGKRQLFTHYKELLTPERLARADAGAGQQVFQKTCGLCHTLFGQGAKIGPDLTGSDRRNLDYLLENILDPSGVVAETYRVWVVTMKDDRVLNGIIAAKNDQTIELQTLSEKQVLQRNDIQSMTESKLSMMPEGLLQSLPDDQVPNLMKHVMGQGPPTAH
ncbi:MAG TPA: c-type cytochrome, partial [Candidatus Dormibacteraeota bacterium]|nr:c-type cytochrome [Candidatus Dormibacteraeota bacterium]